MIVIKRDGRESEFNKTKIYDAIIKAFADVDGEITTYAKSKASEIAAYVTALDRDLTVEEIQDIVEAQKLMSSNRKDVAKAYVIYRNDRSRIRESKSKLIKDIAEKLMVTNVENQNANMDEKSFLAAGWEQPPVR